MNQDSQSKVLQKLKQLHITFLVALALNVVYVAVIAWFVISDPKLPDYITFDRSILKIIAIISLFWLSIGCLQSLHFIALTRKAMDALTNGHESDAVFLGQSWSVFPVGMPVCIVSQGSSRKPGTEKYFTVVPLDRNNFVLGLISPKSQSNASKELRVYGEKGTHNPLCLVGAEQSFLVCWGVPKWSSIRKITG